MDPLVQTLLRDSDLKLWMKESGIYPAVVAPSKPANAEKNVFLTGCSGFLGRYILLCLLSDPNCGQVYCHIRPSSSRSGKDRLFSILSASFPGHPDTLHSWFKEKIRIVEGDLSKPLIGLDQATFQHLAHSVDVIIHNGNNISFFKSYEDMRLSNVDSTKAMLRLAMTGRSKFVNYVSTFSVMMPIEGPTDESASLPHAERKTTYKGFGSIYNYSKWVSDKLVGEAIRNGFVRGALTRPSLVGPHLVNGECNERDFLTIMIGAMIELEAVPLVRETSFPLTPVDYVTAAIAAVSLKGNTSEDLIAGATYPAYNFSYSHSLFSISSLLDGLKQLMPQIKTMDFSSFKRLAADRKDSGSAFVSRMHNISAAVPASKVLDPALFLGKNVEQMNDSHTSNILLKNYNIHSPPYSSDSISRFLRKLIGVVQKVPK